MPLWFQWYLRPFGDHTTFTLFPWGGFVLAGAAAGALLADAQSQMGERRLLAGFGLAGAGIVGLGFYTATLPTIYQSSSFWTSSPTYFAIRVGAMLAALSVFFAIAQVVPRAVATLSPVETFGRNSLFIYWIHVELVYGYATWVIRHKMPLWGTGVAFVAFVALMYSAIGWRDRLVELWRRRSVRSSTAGAVPA